MSTGARSGKRSAAPKIGRTRSTSSAGIRRPGSIQVSETPTSRNVVDPTEVSDRADRNAISVVSKPVAQDLPQGKKIVYAMVKRLASFTVLTAIAAGIATGLTLYLTNREVTLAEQAQIADRLDKAQIKLESGKASDQLNGLFELQRIAETFPDRKAAVIDRISVFLKVKAGAAQESCGSRDVVNVATTALTVIGRINEGAGGMIDLVGACLTRIELAEVNLSNIDFGKSNLSGSTFIDVKFNESRFDFANLSNTKFIMADLTSAIFCYVDTRDAEFRSGKFVHTAIEAAKNDSLGRGSVDLSNLDACP